MDNGFKDIPNGFYSMTGMDAKYHFMVKGERAQLWKDDKIQSSVNKKLHIQRMLTMPIYKDITKIKAL